MVTYVLSIYIVQISTILWNVGDADIRYKFNMYHSTYDLLWFVSLTNDVRHN